MKLFSKFFLTDYFFLCPVRTTDIPARVINAEIVAKKLSPVFGEFVVEGFVVEVVDFVVLVVDVVDLVV